MVRKRRSYYAREKILLEEMFIRSHVLKEWDINVSKIKKVDHDYKIKTYRGNKILIMSLEEERILFMYYALEHLARNGYNQIPRLIRTKYGDPYVKHEGKAYYLIDGIRGHELKSRVLEHLISAVKNLAKFHLAGKKFFLMPGCATRERWTEIPAQMINRIKITENNLVHLPEEFSTAWGMLKEMAQKALDILQKPEFNHLVEQARKDKTLCHRQYSLQNMMLGSNIFVLNWEHCAYGLQVGDLAYFMHKVMPGLDWNWDIGAEIIRGYHSIHNLSPDEMLVLTAYLVFPLSFCRFAARCSLGKIKQKRVGPRLRKILEREKNKTAFLEALLDRYNITILLDSENREKEVTSNIWYCEGDEDRSDQLKNSIGGISCLIPEGYTWTAEQGLEGKINKALYHRSVKLGIPIVPAISAVLPHEPGNNNAFFFDPSDRKSLVVEIDKMLERYNFAGINLDMTIKSAANQEIFRRLLERVSNVTRAKGRLLFTSVPADNNKFTSYDLGLTGEKSDYIIMKMIDDRLIEQTGLGLTLEVIRDNLAYLTSQIPREKIIVLIPVYSYQRSVKENSGQILAFSEAKSLIETHRSEIKYDDLRGGLWGKVSLHGEEKEIWLGDVHAVWAKKSLAQEFSVGGYAFWRLGLEDREIWDRPVIDVDSGESLGEEEDEEYEYDE